LSVVWHRSPEVGRAIPHSYLFDASREVELCGIVTGVPTLAFTEQALLSPKPLPRTVEYYDSKTSGLSVRVLPTGKKLSTSCTGRRRRRRRRVVRTNLGRYLEVDLAGARDRVRATRNTPVAVGDGAPVRAVQGVGHRGHRAALQEEEKVLETGRVRDRRRASPALERPAGRLIKRRDVAQLLNRIADPPRNAPASSDHVRAIVSRLFRFGISQGIEAIEYNPAHGIERAKPAGQRHRVLEPGEIKRLWRV
jgi:hypothetical protein